ncbi:MAG TPA: SAM-dependent methyltransferase [Polyangiaceae bacterium]|nr:SAM-dependent methyltransferase [Polyangiaceae bacterium]
MLRPSAKSAVFLLSSWALGALLLEACGSPPPATSAAPPPASATAPLAAAPPPASPSNVVDADAIVAAADRSDADRALDAGRHPADLLRFFGLRSGMKVAELGAGGGYTTELLSRAVGPSGKVYAENPRFILEKFAEKPWSERLQKPLLANVVRVDREFDDPLPPEAKDLDLVVIVLFYHDTVWLGADRDRMNRSVFAALKPGGIYGIIDHSSRAGAGLADVKTLHRIEQTVLESEVEKAGFKLAGQAEFLRVPGDARDWSTSPSVAGEKRGTSDRFVLAFKKP